MANHRTAISNLYIKGVPAFVYKSFITISQVSCCFADIKVLSIKDAAMALNDN